MPASSVGYCEPAVSAKHPSVYRAAMWTRTAACTVVVGLTVAFSWSPGAATTQSQADDERAIRSVVDQIEAATARNEGTTLGTLWASDYMFVNPAGQRLTRDERVSTFQSGNLTLERYTKDQESVRLYGTTAIVSYRSTVAGARGGMDISSQRRVTMVLVKREGRWQVVSQQSSRIRPAATAVDLSGIRALLQPDAAPPPADAERQVRRLEQAIAEATAKTDVAALEQLWAAEFVWIGPIGQILTRADRLTAMRSGSETSQHYSIDQENVRVYGATAVAIFRSTVAGAVNGKDVSSHRMVTNALVKSGGRWQAVLQHSTVIETR